MKLLPILYDFAVASLADAWIKMCLAIDNHKAVGVASLADAWIKILSASKVPLAFACRIPHGCVD